MVILSKQERSNGDVTSTLLLKNGRASSPTIFSKNFASGSVLSILLLTDTVYFKHLKAQYFGLLELLRM